MNIKEVVYNIIHKTVKKIQPQALLEDKLDLDFIKQITQKPYYIISAGKAGFSFADTFFSYLKKNFLLDRFLGGFVVTPYHTIQHPIEKFHLIESAHPYPDQNSIKAGEIIFNLISTLPMDCNIFFLLSGGASALIEKLIPEISLEELKDLTEQLLKSGATIQEINLVRKKISFFKGGGLANALYPRKVYQYILSDVIGTNSEEYVSSGPMYLDFTPREKIYEIINKYNIKSSIHWEKIQFPEKKHSSLQKTIIVGNNEIACQKLKEVLEEEKFVVQILASNLVGNIDIVVDQIINDIKNYLENTKENRIALIWGGEPTLKVKGTGKGGRNMELTLRVGYKIYEFIKNFKNIKIIFSSFGTDGRDGPTDSAGGFVYFKKNHTFKNSFDELNHLLQSENQNFIDLLNNNDSYHLLKRIHSLILIENTGTNLNDLIFCLLEK